jgi:signal transduction protein with GAF and PtsI domain
MTNPATVDDVEIRFRPLSATERLTAEVLLGDAWVMLLGRRPSLEADMTAGKVALAAVVRVLANMVIRVLRNPDGYLQESIDDYTYRRDAVVSTGLLHLTPDELADITPGRARNRSIRLTVYGDA